MDYGTLKTTVATFLNRSDLTSYIPSFIASGERRINYGSDEPYSSVPLRIPAMQVQTSGTITGSTIAFPSRFLEVIRLCATSGSTIWQLEYADLNTYTQYSNSSIADNSDLPSVYVYLNNSIQTAGPGSAGYVLDYWKAFDALTSDSDTNWLLTNASDVYLYAALLESAPFLMDAQSQTMLPAWYGMYRSAINSLNRVTKRTGPLRVRAN